jgi:glycosyltransferase involved in cell wall biosynthesis
VAEDAHLVVAVRRLEDGLGLDVVLDAVARLGGVELSFVGEGSARAALQARAARLGVSDRVRFAGPAAGDGLVDWYRAADVCVQPPAPHEGFGLALLEALACGTPIVGAAVGAVSEILAPLDPRLLAPAADADALATAIAAAVGAEPSLAPQCRAYAERFAWPSVLDDWEAAVTEAARAPVQEAVR